MSDPRREELEDWLTLENLAEIWLKKNTQWIIDWADRWAKRPSREQILSVLKYHHAGTGFSLCEPCNKIMALFEPRKESKWCDCLEYNPSSFFKWTEKSTGDPVKSGSNFCRFCGAKRPEGA